MDIFTKFKTIVKLREVHVDNEVFQLHYRVTALILLICGALVASRQHFGDPIDCITRDDVPDKIMDTYCWIHATFTLPRACNKSVGIEVAHPCVDSYVNDGEERVYHKYYQWVYFVLFFQAALFYAPHFLWKMWESRLLMRLTVHGRDPLKQQDLKPVVRYMMNPHNRYRHHQYYQYFTVCEVLNFFNVILQIYMVDAFLGGTFTSYGIDVINYSQMEQSDRVDPMVRIFPRMTKCTFNRFGPSGDVNKYDALCILPLNIINEKIYIVMWFWFVFLAIVTGIWLVYRACSFFKPTIRRKVLERKASMSIPDDLNFIVKNFQVGDWFVLSMICNNMDSQWFGSLTRQIADRTKKRLKEKSRGVKNRQLTGNGLGSFPSDKTPIRDSSDSEADSQEDDEHEPPSSVQTNESGDSPRQKPQTPEAVV